MRASRQAGRVLVLALAVLILVSTAWVCLIGAAVVLLSDWLGTGLALLAVAGGLFVLLAIIFLVASALRQAEPPSPPERPPLKKPDKNESNSKAPKKARKNNLNRI